MTRSPRSTTSERFQYQDGCSCTTFLDLPLTRLPCVPTRSVEYKLLFLNQDQLVLLAAKFRLQGCQIGRNRFDAELNFPIVNGG
jgi:hypothetical protein